MSGQNSPARFGVVVPVRPPSVAKSRLRALGDEARAELVVAFAADTVQAVLECPLVMAVLVVTDDHVVAKGLLELGASVIPDGHAEDLNATLVQGAAELTRRHPGLRPVALCADLPALTAADLGAALAALPDDRPGFVSDTQGVGTTLFAGTSLADFDPRFGAGSRQAHADSGAAEVVLEVPSLRRDVDTPEDLAAALRLGVGGRTSLVATRHRL